MKTSTKYLVSQDFKLKFLCHSAISVLKQFGDQELFSNLNFFQV